MSVLNESLEPIRKPTILDSEMRVRHDSQYGGSHLTLHQSQGESLFGRTLDSHIRVS